MPVTLIRAMGPGSVVDDDDEAEFRATTPAARRSCTSRTPVTRSRATSHWSWRRCSSTTRWGSTELAGEGSNLQPTDSKSVVLPIELPATTDAKDNLRRFLANVWRRLTPTSNTRACTQ